MEKTIIVDNEYATLWYYPESQTVHHQFHKFIHGKVLRDLLARGLDTFQQHNANKWLSDDRKNSALPQADYEWANNHWVNPMIDSGWKYWAMVLPDNTVGKTVMKRVIEDYATRGLTVEIFETPEAAYDWLASV